MSTKSFMGKGVIYLEEIGGTAGLLDIGNASSLDLTFNEDKKEMKDFQQAGGAVIDTVSRISSVTGSLTALSFDAKNLALAIRGLEVVHASAAIASEAHVARFGGHIPFVNLPDTTQTITVTDTGAVETFIVDVDYEVVNGGVRILDAPTNITEGEAIEVNYTSLDSTRVEGLTSGAKKYRIVFDGLNEADDKPVRVELYRTNFNPVQALALISEDFGELALTFDILKDSTKVGAGISKFMNIIQAN